MYFEGINRSNATISLPIQHGSHPSLILFRTYFLLFPVTIPSANWQLSVRCQVGLVDSKRQNDSKPSDSPIKNGKTPLALVMRSLFIKNSVGLTIWIAPVAFLLF